MRYAIAMMALVLVGCSTTPGGSSPGFVSMPTESETNCLNVATYGRAIALMRNNRVHPDQIDSILPNQPKYPVYAIQRYVYDHDSDDPAEISLNIYASCMKVGFDEAMHNYYQEDMEYLDKNRQEK